MGLNSKYATPKTPGMSLIYREILETHHLYLLKFLELKPTLLPGHLRVC